jgi:HSP20 family protein
MSDIIKIKPQRLSRELDSFFDPFTRFFREEPFQIFNTFNSFSEDYDVVKTDNGFQIEYPIPGFKKSEISLTHNGDVLKIEGEMKNSSDRNFIYHGNKRKYFSYELNIGSTAEVEEATMEDGILKIKVKSEKFKNNSKKITIK